MLYHWESEVLGSYWSGSIIIEADSIEHARDLFLEQLTNPDTYLGYIEYEKLQRIYNEINGQPHSVRKNGIILIHGNA